MTAHRKAAPSTTRQKGANQKLAERNPLRQPQRWHSLGEAPEPVIDLIDRLVYLSRKWNNAVMRDDKAKVDFALDRIAEMFDEQYWFVEDGAFMLSDELRPKGKMGRQRKQGRHGG